MINVELDEEMDMPCLCDCGTWFDLNDGKSSELKPNKVICKNCYETEQEAKTTIGKLTKNKKFIWRGTTYQVIKKFRSENSPLEAFETDYRTGKPIEFIYPEDEVFLVDYKTELPTRAHGKA